MHKNSRFNALHTGWAAPALLALCALSQVRCAGCAEAIELQQPCEITQTAQALEHQADPSGLAALTQGAYWELGPYFTWTTSPAPECVANPIALPTSDRVGTNMMVTYPTAQNPQTSGHGNPAQGPFPMIVFSHANNDSVCSIFERYRSLHQHWASWGYIVVSVDDTAFNCMRGNRKNLVDRSNAQLAALDAMARWSKDPNNLFYQRVDPQRVVLAGHSRGGGASLVSWSERKSSDIKGIIDLQGVDMTAFGFGSPSITLPVLGISAFKDVDLNYPHVEPTEDQLRAPYTWVTINGGIHAYTADTVPIEPDDRPSISQTTQQKLTAYYSTAFLRQIVGLGDGSASPAMAPTPTPEVLASHEGAQRALEEISEQGVHVRWRTFAPQTVLIDAFEGPRDANGPELNELGGSNTSQGLTRDEQVPVYSPDKSPRAMYRKSYGRMLVAGDGAGSFTTTLSVPLQAQDGASLQARIKGPDTGSMPDFDVVVQTQTGEVRVAGENIRGPLGLTNRYVQMVLPFDTYGLEGALIQGVQVELREGTLFLDDLRIVPSP